MRYAKIAVILVLAWQDAGAETLTLRQAAEAVLHQNPELAVSQARVQQAESGLKQAQGAQMPHVRLSVTASRTNDALGAFGLKLGQQRITAADFVPATLNSPDAINNVNTRVEVQAPLYTGGQMQAQRREAEALVRASRDGDEAARQQLLLNTLKAWQGVHLARAYLQVAEQGRAAAAEALRVADSLHKQGAAVKSDALSARVNLEDAKLRVSEARRLEADALDRLKLLMGRPLGETLEVGAEFLPALPPGVDEDLRAQALNQHPALKALRAQVDAAGAGVEAARGARRPQISALARQDWNDKSLGLDAASYTLAGVLSWNAFDGGVAKAGVDRAQATRLEQAAKLRQAEDGIAYQITEARRRALEAEERLSARQSAVQQAEEAQRLTQLRYQNGVTTLVDLLAAQAQLDRTRADLAQARFDRAAARGEVLHAAGLLTLDQF
ncbi:MAG: TolC family protein [Betaproteobacteria bacterium]|nr:TolC family protein [Betaproteobacteria bacterium]